MSNAPASPPILDLVVQLGIVRMRTAVGRTPEEAYLPRMFLWVDERSGAVLHFLLDEPQENYAIAVLLSLGGLAKRIHGVPRRIQLRDPKLATELRQALEPSGIEVVVRESLPMLDQAVAGMMENKGLGGEPEPGVLDQPGMTLDHLIAFANAAKAFYEARPWRHLIDDDLIEIASPDGPAGTRFTQVLGAGGSTYGLGFVPTRKAHEELRAGAGLPRGPIWTLQFGDIDELPFDDGEAWERHALPVAGPEAYPSFLCMTLSGTPGYPKPHELIWAEGLLRAIASSTEEELDGGRWEKTVETMDGPRIYRLSLPILLDQLGGKSVSDPEMDLFSARTRMEAMLRAIGQQLAERGPMGEKEMQAFNESLVGKQQVFTPKTDAERAQALCYQAQESRGRRQVQLAREALAIDPDCVDAMLLLAERSADPESALPLYQRAVEGGERQLGRERFEEDAGDFWGIVETRPYMRARHALAVCLMALDRHQEAADHLTDLIRLNPRDNQGNRYPLAQALLCLNELDRLKSLLSDPEYRDDRGAEWAFTHVLLEYRENGDTPAARGLLAAADRFNRHVLPLLTGRKPMPTVSPSAYSLGSEDEAILAVQQIADGWEETPGAIEWLDARFKAKRRMQKGARKPNKRRKK